MKMRRTLFCTAGLVGLGLALTSPALAAVDVRAESASLTDAPSIAAAGTRIDPGCSKPIAPALGIAPAISGSPATSKSAAILGGKMSRLEMMALQQAAAAAPALTKTPALTAASAPTAAPSIATQPVADATAVLPEIARGVPGEGIEPAAGGFTCPTTGSTGLASASFARTGFANAGLVGLPGRTPLGSNDFLASKRLPVSRTTFDAAWGRVQGGALPKSMLRRAFGNGDQAVTRDRIAAINSWTNKTVRYVEDRDLYGQADYWASARTTLKRRAGDCEDIAIAKMQLLAAMGVPRSDMYLTIARDLARNADHAMLVVKFEGEHLLLDNATNTLLDASQSYDYRPILSFNTAQTWLHGY